MSLVTQVTALGQRVAAEIKAQRSRRPLPAYIALTSSTGGFDPSSGLYNVTAANNAPFATAMKAARAGTGLCHDVFIGASDMSAYDGTSLRAPLSWPEYYRQAMSTVGITSGGTGLLPLGDPLGVSDSRVVLSGFAAAYGGDFTYAGGSGATATFTPDVAGQLVLTYDQASVAFTVKIGAATAVTVTPTGAGSTLGVYSPAGTVPAGTSVVVTSTGTLTLYLIGTIGTAGYVKHNLAGSSMGAATSNDAAHFTASLLDGAWDPTVAPSYYSRARATYTSLSVAGVVANRVTISLGANDLAAGKTNTQITAAITNIIARFPGATVRLVLAWQMGTITDTVWESFAAALYAYATTNGYQLLDWRYQLGNYARMQTTGVLGADGYHIALPAQQVLGDATARADTAELSTAALLASTPTYLYEAAGTYPARPVSSRPTWWIGPDKPSTGGTITSGTGMVAGLDFWFKTS